MYDPRNDNLCKLLYPIKEKNYQENNFISSEWTAIKHYLSNASMLTIFGYSAPTTDKEAVALLQAGWGNGGERELEQIELIDVKPQSELLSTWDSFVHSHHYTIYNNFYHSFIAKYPRRSCDAMNMQNFYCKFLDGGIEPDDNSPWKMDFSGLEEWFKNLILSEG